MNNLFFIFVLFLCTHTILKAQCAPPWADQCQDADVLCGLVVLNGYSCTSLDYSNPTGCTPLCPAGGAPRNTGWWAFQGGGGNATIQMVVSNCSVNGSGLRLGIWADCSCNQNVACNFGCTGPGNYSVSANLAACITYYLYIDGCSGDVCDFVFNISGIGAQSPKIAPFGSISGPKDVCEGACNVMYSVAQGTVCTPNYEWTLDGNPVGNNSHSIAIDFTERGDFVLCVTAYIGDPLNGSVCDQEGPSCIVVRSRKNPDRRGLDQFICRERIPYLWHGQIVDNTGEYRAELVGSNCCKFDSVKNFIVLDPPENPDFFHIGCSSSDPFIEPNTRQQFNTCQFKRRISLPRSTIPWRCDSAYFLNAIFLDYRASFDVICQDSMVLEARIQDSTTVCNNIDLRRTLRYKWYLKSDSQKRSIGTGAQLTVDKKEDYCLDLEVDVRYGDKSKVCLFTFCESINEDMFKPVRFCPSGDTSIVRGARVLYTVDTSRLSRNARGHSWSIKNGRIETRSNGFDSTKVSVLWNGIDTEGEICYKYRNECLYSDECCRKVRFITSNEDINSHSNYLDFEILPNPVTSYIYLRLISGENPDVIELVDYFGVKRWEILNPSFSQNESLWIPLEGLSPGIFFIRCRSGAQLRSRRLVVFN